MIQRVVDSALGVAKESVKTLSQELFNSFVRLVNGVSAILLAVLPGKTSALEAVTGWEQYPTFRSPRMTNWMAEGVSSFNKFLPEFDFDSDESEYESEYATDTEDEGSVPPSPCFSQDSSRHSRGSSIRSVSFRRHSIFRRVWRNITWPIRYVLRWISRRPPPSRNLTPSNSDADRTVPGRLRRTSGSSGSFQIMLNAATKHFSDMKDLLVNHRTTDSRRRGIIEDLQLGVELFIERVFEIVRKCILHCLSPLETLKAILRRIFFRAPPTPIHNDETVHVVKTATLGDSEPSLQHDIRRYALQPLNTDARTCGDFITSMGYPYESLKVTTSDGYILSLERIPRPESKKVLYLQHGILDSSLGWVSCGVVGSQAFSSYDQGYDVFLGNFRGLASRDHVNKHISSQRYWRYSVNEHGTEDIPAMLDKVHELKMTELKQLKLLSDEELGSSSETGSAEKVPYSLCGVSHSLAGAAMLIYIVTRRLQGKPHYLKRAILLSPAGFHEKAPPVCALLQYLFPLLAPVIRPFFPGFYIPTKFFRMMFNKLSRDFQNYPALGGLVQTLMSYAVGGDSSNWVGAFGVTHYNMEDMPGIALGVALHLAQMMRSKRFRMFDYGSRTVNMQVYGSRQPLDVGANYGVIDIPIDVVAGKKDKLIPKSMVGKHYQCLKDCGVKASYAEFDYAHLDFTFSNRDEVLDYVTSRLLLVQPNQKRKVKRKYHLSKAVKGDGRKGWSQGAEGDNAFYTENSYARSKTLTNRRRSGDLDNPQQDERRSAAEVNISPGSNGSADSEVSQREVEEEAASSGRDAQKPAGKEETKDHMSYQDAHAAAVKFLNDYNTGFRTKNVMPSFRSRNSQSKSSTASPADRMEDPQEQSSPARRTTTSKHNEVAPNPVVEALKRPSSLRRVKPPGLDAGSSSLNWHQKWN